MAREDRFTTTEHDAGLYEAHHGEAADTPEPADREASFTDVKPSYLPEFGPDDCLWLVTVQGQWPVYAHTSESSAMYNAKREQDGIADYRERYRVRVTKVTIADYQPLEYLREVIRESLVPKEEGYE